MTKRPDVKPERDVQRDPEPPVRDDSAHTRHEPGVESVEAPAHRNVLSATILVTLLVFAALAVVFLVFAF